jgi:tetratricopeptide (TPR) repeat protein
MTVGPLSRKRLQPIDLMMKASVWAVARIATGLSIFALAALAANVPDTRPDGLVLEQAMRRIYSLDFPGGQRVAREVMQRNPQAPLPPAVLAAGLLFSELDRLNLLKDGEKAQGKPDPAARQAMRDAVEDAMRRANAVLEETPDNAEGLTALMIAEGVERDYLALVEKSYRQSWVHAKKAQEHALKLIARHPEVKDAWFTVGFSDYLISTVPFVFRPFMKMEQADGDRRQAVRKLEKAAEGGRYLKGFAQMILVGAYRKEGRRADAERMLATLAREYPQNGAIRKEMGSPSGY